MFISGFLDPAIDSYDEPSIKFIERRASVRKSRFSNLILRPFISPIQVKE